MVTINNGSFQQYGGSFSVGALSPTYNLVTSGIILYLNAGNSLSYPGSGTSWFSLYNNVTGSLVNGPTYTSAGASSSINFDGTNDYMYFNPSSSLTGLTTLTANMWLNIKDVGAVLFYKSDNNSTRGWFIEYGDNIGGGSGINGFGFSAVTNTTNLRYFINKNQIPTGSWANFVITWDGVFPNTAGTAVKIYINGVENTNVNYNIAGTGTRSADTNADPLSFGQSNSTGTTNSDYYSGSIGIVSLYNRNLTAAEVLQNFNAIRAVYGV